MINLDKYNIKLLIDFDSTFIKSESLDIISSISLNHHPSSIETINQIKELTSKAMEGKISFSDALLNRIQLLDAKKEHIDLTIKKIKDDISDSFKRNKDFFINNFENCYIISGGFTDIIEPVISDFCIPKKNIFANDLIFDDKGYLKSINKQNPLSQDLGKIAAAKTINGEKIIIGDGYTDYEVRKHGVASYFIQHIENINRKNLNKNADFISNNLDKTLSYIKKIYQNG